MSKNRLLLLFFPMLLYNARILARHLFCRDARSIIWITLKIFSEYLEALTQKSVRLTPTDPDRPRQTQTDPDRPRQTPTDPDRPRQTPTDPG